MSGYLIYARALRELPQFYETMRNIAVLYNGAVAPEAVILLISGAWLIVEYFDGWNSVDIPWLAGMVFLFAFGFIEGNTVTRIYFIRLCRLTEEAPKTGNFNHELQKARAEAITAFTHFPDLPLMFLIVALGVIKPDNWTLFIAGMTVAALLAAMLTCYIPRLYPSDIEAKGG